MIALLKGTLLHKTSQDVIVDVGGVGYAVFMPSTDISQLLETGTSVELYTYLYVREDTLALYGFLSLEEKVLFEQFIGVSGVGPKVALAALSFYSPPQLTRSITSQDVSGIAKIPGIGKKTAQRLILELKGSLDEGLLSDETGDYQQSSVSDDAARQGAQEALLSMGFTMSEADLALKGAPTDMSEAQLLQWALKKLGGRV